MRLARVIAILGMLARVIAILGLLASVTGCGASDSEQVKATVEELASATAHRDYRAICDEVLAPSLIQHLSSNGISCVQALRLALGGVQNPMISVGKVTVHGRAATVLALATARNQQAAIESIELVKTGAGWRITSLGSPSSGQASG